MNFSIQVFTKNYPEQELLEIWGQGLSGLDSQRIKWSYVNNPEGGATVSLAVDDDKSVVFGALAGFPRKLYYKGNLLNAVITGDFAILPSYRSLLPALQLQRAIISRDEFSIIIGFPNKQGYLVQKRVGFLDFGQLTRFVKILRCKEKISKYVPCVFSSVIAPPIDFFMKAYAKHWFVKLPRLVFKPLDFSVGDLDLIWEEAKCRFDFILNRTSEYLQWRFFDHPYKKYNILLFCDKFSRKPCGYVIYRLDDKVVYAEDFLWSGDEKTLMSMIVQFQRHCFASGMSVVCFECFASSLVKNVFGSIGYISRSGDKVVGYSSNKEFLTDLDTSKVFLTIGDNDI